MKVVKIIGLVLLVLVIVFLILGIVVPGDYLVEREITIDAPPELVFQHVKYWKNWHEWSPWAERDSTMEVTVEGEDGKTRSADSPSDPSYAIGHLLRPSTFLVRYSAVPYSSSW